MLLKAWLYNRLKSTMLILDNQVSIIIQNNFKCRKLKYNQSKFRYCDLWYCLALHNAGGKRERKLFSFCAFIQRRGKKACIGPQEEKLISRLEVIFYQQELNSSS